LFLYFCSYNLGGSMTGTRQLHVDMWWSMAKYAIFWDGNRPRWIGSSRLLQVPESYVAELKIQIYKLLPSVVSLVRNVLLPSYFWYASKIICCTTPYILSVFWILLNWDYCTVTSTFFWCCNAPYYMVNALWTEDNLWWNALSLLSTW
jgi:hypothetical protein